MIEICLLIIPNAFKKAKRQAEESDHQRICVEGKFWHNLVFYTLGLGASTGWQRDPL